MSALWNVTINGSWECTTNARNAVEACTMAGDLWRAEFTDGEDRGTIDQIHAQQTAEPAAALPEWPERYQPGGSPVKSACPSCGVEELREPYDIGSGPELSCRHCEWCWGAEGQDLKPLPRPRLKRFGPHDL